MSDLRKAVAVHQKNLPAVLVRWLTLLACCGLFANSHIVAQEKQDKTPIEDKAIPSLADGWPLKLTYYKSTAGKEAAVVLLMHMKGENRLVWSAPSPTAPKGFAEQLQSKGFAVIAMDLRKHGQSKPGAETDDTKKAIPADKEKAKKTTGGTDLKPADYQLMVRDMDSIKRFIYEEHQKGNLNMRKMAIVAPGMSAAIGITFAAADWQKTPFDDAPTPAGRTPRGQDVQAMVFLSPETTLPGVPAHQVVPQFKAISAPMAALILVGKNDPQDKDQAKTLFKQLGGDPTKTAEPKKAVDSKKTAEPKKASKEKEKEKEAEKENKERLFYFSLNAKLHGTELLGTKLGIEEPIIGFLHDHVQQLKGPEYEWRDRKSKLE